MEEGTEEENMRSNFKSIIVLSALGFAFLALAFGGIQPVGGRPAQASVEKVRSLSTHPSNQEGLVVTAYDSNLGLVKDLRRIPLLPGLIDLKFSGVAAQIMP
jgi:hypothetical protein